MSSSNPNFGSTFASGIQDVSAFLPIFGTDQCERHLGDALVDGFLYAAVTPLSMFGCLGIVKASLAILVASMSSTSARLLRDAGLTLSGSAASMIGLLPDAEEGTIRNLQSRRFLRPALPRLGEEYRVAGQFSDLYKKHYPQQAEYMDFTFRYLEWNLKLIASTFTISLLSIAPYIPIIISDRKHSPVTVWVYPFLRIFGASVSVIAAQVILQMRIKILFRKVQSTTMLAMPGCQIERGEYDTLLLLTAQVAIALGACATGIGYLGCFTLVQRTKSLNAFIWLGLEAALSVLRLLIWAWNPSIDEDTGITVKIKLGLSADEFWSKFRPQSDTLAGKRFIHRAKFLERLHQYIGYRSPIEGLSTQRSTGIYYHSDPNEPNALHTALTFDTSEGRQILVIKTICQENDKVPPPQTRSYEGFQLAEDRMDIMLRIENISDDSSVLDTASETGQWLWSMMLDSQLLINRLGKKPTHLTKGLSWDCQQIWEDCVLETGKPEKKQTV